MGYPYPPIARVNPGHLPQTTWADLAGRMASLRRYLAFE